MKRTVWAAAAVLVLSLIGYGALQVFARPPAAVSILSPLATPAGPDALVSSPKPSVSRPAHPKASAPAGSAKASPSTKTGSAKAGSTKASGSSKASASSKAPTAPSVKPAPSGRPSSSRPAASKPVVKAQVASACTGNQQPQFILVDISQQHAWMCAYGTQVYDSPVTTGAAAVGNATPTGTWHIEGKQGARYLTVRGGASYHVQFWMPYDGDYGFHDAAWQTFPEGSPLWPTQGSHGCVHLPLNAMTWLYDWASVGATVTVRT